MTTPTLLLLLAFQIPQSFPLHNSFVTGVETLIDTATTLDLKADTTTYDPQFKSLTTIKDNLKALADNPREDEIAQSAYDLTFLVSACHLQATNNTDTTKCSAQIANANKRLMTAINKHKANGQWQDGPPA